MAQTALDKPLCHFGANPWTLRAACEGVQIFGATGSGKTSGSGLAIARTFLEQGFGGLVLTAKPEDSDLWLTYCAQTGRSRDLLILAPDAPYRFNFITYEHQRADAGGGLTENLVNLFTRAIEAVTNHAQASGDSYWIEAPRQLLRNAIDTLSLSGSPVTLPNIKRLIDEAPRSSEDARSPAWQETSLFADCFAKLARTQAAGSSVASPPELELAIRYWTTEFPGLSDKTRASIISSFTAMADPLLRGVLHTLFCTETNFRPEDSFNGRIILLDLPLKQFGVAGRAAQILFKSLWQDAAERRPRREDTRPVFLWADEAQYFLTSTDPLFQQTARSARVCTVYLTQNLSNYYLALGRADAKHYVESLLGNLTTKIFHANDHIETNRFAAELIARNWAMRRSMTVSENANSSASLSPALDYQLLPSAFQSLRRGGPSDDYQVDAILFRGGVDWGTSGKNYLRVSFDQRGA
ncbi:MAG: hypothetical protein WEF50_10705 [Myxococcota bacterium]